MGSISPTCPDAFGERSVAVAGKFLDATVPPPFVAVVHILQYNWIIGGRTDTGQIIERRCSDESGFNHDSGDARLIVVYGTLVQRNLVVTRISLLML